MYDTKRKVADTVCMTTASVEYQPPTYKSSIPTLTPTEDEWDDHITIPIASVTDEARKNCAARGVNERPRIYYRIGDYKWDRCLQREAELGSHEKDGCNKDG